MYINTMYTFSKEKMRKPLYGMNEEDSGHVMAAYVWLTDDLNLAFQSMDELDYVIGALQELKSKAAGREWATPSVFYLSQGSIDVAVHDVVRGDIEYRKQNNHNKGALFETILVKDAFNAVTFYFPHGQEGAAEAFAKEIQKKIQEKEEGQ